MASFLQIIVKIMLIVINFIVLVFGLLLAGLGIYSFVKLKDTEIAHQFNVEAASTALIILGCIILVISFFGFWGAIRRSKCLLITFACFMLLLIAAYGFCLYVVTAGIGDFNFNQIKLHIDDHVAAVYDEESNSKGIGHVLEDMLHCCGANGPNSYSYTTLPYTCCTEEHTSLKSYYDSLISMAEVANKKESSKYSDPKYFCPVGKAHETGCIDAAVSFIVSIQNHIKHIIIGKLVLISLEFIGAVYLSSTKSSKQKYDRKSHY